MPQKFTLTNRASGLLLHPTSLPGPFGIGDLGPEAYRFVDFLAATGQTWWQMFPVGPCGIGHSPYQALSAFAGNPLLLSLEKMVEHGLLPPEDAKPVKKFPEDKVNFKDAQLFKELRLQKAYRAFEKKAEAEKELNAFLEKNAVWLEDYSLFCALKEAHGGKGWDKWEMEWRLRKPTFKESAMKEFGREIRYHQFLQYQFYLQWSQLKDYCHQKGIGLIGDVPIFVALDSTDVWTHPNLFWLDSEGKPTVVAGVPPDYFSKTGQRWGNPLYRWAVLRDQGYDWWINRLRITFERFDAVRLDHFIGFHNYWEIASTMTTGVEGRWVPGPGADFFEKVFEVLGKVEFIAEDLGEVTDEVVALREKLAVPGMRVLQFGFGEIQKNNIHLPHTFHQDCVAYTGTHDNDTTMGWFKGLATSAKSGHDESAKNAYDHVIRYVGTNGRSIHWDMIRLAQMSVANTAIIPVQDLLGLGSRSRMNVPGTASGNWTWRMKGNDLKPEIASRLSDFTEISGRARVS